MRKPHDDELRCRVALIGVVRGRSADLDARHGGNQRLLETLRNGVRMVQP